MQRLTTAPPRRHAPRFFLSGAQVANPVTKQDVQVETALFPLRKGISPLVPPLFRPVPHRSATGRARGRTGGFPGGSHLWSTAKDAP
ncbi:hypothetical protein STXM2123_3266 [Streptomyces sp. F-3]|nr:hypothetical protein STXM2123_3266 [Streptomyces sp. F-3]